MEPAAARGRPRSAEVDDRILRTALEQLRRRGYADLSVERVAAAAGVGKATVYRRYRNKADLASAAIATVSSRAYAGPPPDDTYEALVDHLKRFEGGVARVGLGAVVSMIDERDEELLELHRERTIARGHARARLILERAQARGEIRPDADLEIAMEMLFGTLFASRLSGEQRPDWAESAVSTLLRGLAR